MVTSLLENLERIQKITNFPDHRDNYTMVACQELYVHLRGIPKEPVTNDENTKLGLNED